MQKIYCHMSLVLCLHISLSNIIPLEIHGRIMLVGTIYHAACTCSLSYLMMVPKAFLHADIR
jgi:hypothetical protein